MGMLFDTMSAFPRLLAIVLVAVVACAAQARASESCSGFQLVGPPAPNGKLILLEVGINGQRPIPMVLDTGSTTTVLTPAVAKHLHLPSIDGIAGGVGASGAFRASVSVLPTVAVGGALRHHVLVAIADVGQVGHFAGTTIDGLLGYSFLSPYRVSIDYPKQRVCFTH